MRSSARVTSCATVVRRISFVIPRDAAAQRDRLHVLDVREPEEWDAGHIEGAQHIPLGQLGERLGEVPKDAVILCVCRAGVRSELARRGLESVGFRAENLDGGVERWVRDGLALVTPEGKAGRVI